jgi:hypothetical protein
LFASSFLEEKEKQKRETRTEVETKENRKAALDDLVARREKQKTGRSSEDYDFTKTSSKCIHIESSSIFFFSTSFQTLDREQKK